MAAIASCEKYWTVLKYLFLELLVDSNCYLCHTKVRKIAYTSSHTPMFNISYDVLILLLCTPGQNVQVCDYKNVTYK